MEYLVCEPRHYGVHYEINPWMHTGKPADELVAQQQWQVLKETLIQCGAQLHVLTQPKGWPDIVFTANAGLVYKKQVVLSHFRHHERQGERPYFEAWFKAAGFNIMATPETDYQMVDGQRTYAGPCFEGAGDALFAGDVLFAGYGFRTDFEFYEQIRVLGITQLVFCELVDPRFYHIDTCFCPLNAKQAIWWPKAFTSESQQRMEQALELFAVPEDEALRFACNAVVVGNYVVIPSNCPETRAILTKLGYTVRDCEMGEFLKAGGACKCLTLALD